MIFFLNLKMGQETKSHCRVGFVYFIKLLGSVLFTDRTLELFLVLLRFAVVALMIQCCQPHLKFKHKNISIRLYLSLTRVKMRISETLAYALKNTF